MTKAEFIATAKARGVDMATAKNKFNELDAAGKFSDSVKPQQVIQAAPKVEPIAVAEPKKPAYVDSGPIGSIAQMPKVFEDYSKQAEQNTIERAGKKANIPLTALAETMQKTLGAPMAAALHPVINPVTSLFTDIDAMARKDIPGYKAYGEFGDKAIGAIGNVAKKIPADLKNIVDIVGNIVNVVPAGALTGAVSKVTGKAVPAAIKGTGNVVEGLGKEVLGGELKIKQNLAQKGYGRTLAEKKTNILNNISKYGIEDPTGNFIKMGAKTDDLIDNTVNESNKILQKLSTGEKAIFIDPAAVVERAATKSIDGAALGMTDNIKNEYSNILKDMESRGMVGRQPLSSLVEVKKLLDPDGNLFKTGPYISDADNATRGLRKQMYLDIVEEVGNISPEIKALNKKTKELIDIKSVLDDAASRTTNNKFLGLVQKLTGLGAIGASAIHSPEAAAALGSVLAASKMGEQGRGASALIKTGKGIKNVSEKLKQEIPISDAMKRFIGGKK